MTWFSASAAPGDLRPVLHKPVPRPPRPQRLLREIPGRDEEEEGAGLGPEGVGWAASRGRPLAREGKTSPGCASGQGRFGLSRGAGMPRARAPPPSQGSLGPPRELQALTTTLTP